MFAVLFTSAFAHAISSMTEGGTHTSPAEPGSCWEDATFATDWSAGEALMQTSKHTLSVADLYGQSQPTGQPTVDAAATRSSQPNTTGQPQLQPTGSVPGEVIGEINKMYRNGWVIFWVSGSILVSGVVFCCFWHFRIVSSYSTVQMQLRMDERQGTGTTSQAIYLSEVSTPEGARGTPIYLSEGSTQGTASDRAYAKDETSDSTDNAPEENDEDKQNLWQYLDESHSSWRLGLDISISVTKVWSMLGLLYWSIFWHTGDLMQCFDHPHSLTVLHMCTFTGACLRGFLVAACNVTLVLMIRILIQSRMYYSLLSLGHVVNFMSHQKRRRWPMTRFLMLSMTLGSLNLLLKMIFDPEPIDLARYGRLIHKFIIPGGVFLAMFYKYTDLDSLLVPLNVLVARDCSSSTRRLPQIASLQALDEVVLAHDARWRDVVGDTMDKVGKRPTLGDVVQNVLDTYDHATESYVNWKRLHPREAWGFFKSLWPAALLLDPRLDYSEDKKTRDWRYVIGSLLVVCIVILFISLMFFVASVRRYLELRTHIGIAAPYRGYLTEIWLAISVLAVHFTVILFFIERTIQGMFFFAIQAGKHDA